MSSELAVAAGAIVALIAAPYLAGLSVSAPERGTRDWWRPRRTTRRRCVVTAAVGVLLAALAGVATGWTASWPAYLVLALLGTVLVLVDAEHHRLPDRVTAPTAVAGVVLFAVAAAVEGTWSQLSRVALAAVVVFAVFYLFALISPRGVGLGDVKLTALLAGYLAWFGWLTVIGGIAGGLLLAGVASILALISGHASRTTPVPLGPFLITAALLVAALCS